MHSKVIRKRYESVNFAGFARTVMSLAKGDEREVRVSNDYSFLVDVDR